MSSKSEFISKAINTLDPRGKADIVKRFIDSDQLLPYIIEKIRHHNLEAHDVSLLRALGFSELYLTRIQQITSTTLSVPSVYSLACAFDKYVSLYKHDNSDEHVDQIIKYGPHGNTAMHLVLWQEQYDTIRELLDVFSTTQQARLLGCESVNNRTVIGIAIENNHLDFLEQYLPVIDPERYVAIFTERLSEGKLVIHEFLKHSDDPAADIPRLFKLLEPEQRFAVFFARDDYSHTTLDYLKESLASDLNDCLANFLSAGQIKELPA